MHVLIIEDDNDHSELVLRTLQRNRVAGGVERLCDGEEALEYLRRGDSDDDRPRPDLILLDLKLPKVSGHEVLAQIKSDPQLQEIPVIVLTTSDAEADRREAYCLHANSYLVKPLNYERFRRMIADMAHYWTVWNEPSRN